MKITIVSIALVLGLLACREESPVERAQLGKQLFESIQQGELERVDSCLRAGAHLEARNTEGATPLIAAAVAGRPDIVRHLLGRGADVQARRNGYYGSTALMEAAVRNDTAIGRILLDYGADVHRRDTFGDPAINWAAYYGHISFTRLLLERGAEWAVAGRHGNALDIAVKEWNLPLLEFFIHRGAGQPIPQEEARRFLAAVRSGAMADVDYWLQYGLSPDQKDELGTPALLWAAARGHDDIVERLLQRGAKPDATNRAGQTALAAAARFGREPALKLLLQAGADPNAAAAPYRLTPLISAAQGGHAACARLLLQAGADPDRPEVIDGYTPLMYAAIYNHSQMVHLLIEFEANPYIKSKDGTGIYDLISYSANPELFKLIEAYVLNRQ